VAALVAELGVEAPGGARTFPTPAALAEAKESVYRDVVRAGYRGPYLKTLAGDIAEGRIALEELNDPSLADEEVAERLLALPGVGPYAAAHVMLTSLARYSRLSLDASTRSRNSPEAEWLSPRPARSPCSSQISRARRSFSSAPASFTPVYLQTTGGSCALRSIRTMGTRSTLRVMRSSSSFVPRTTPSPQRRTRSVRLQSTRGVRSMS